MNLMTLIPAAQKWWDSNKTAEDDLEFEAAWAQVFPRVDLDPIESISPGHGSRGAFVWVQLESGIEVMIPVKH